MAAKNKRHPMTEALKNREEVRAFLEAGKINNPTPTKSPVAPLTKAVEPRMAVTLRLPEKTAHALIDESAERRKNRKRNWSQQDIVAEAVLKLLGK